MGGSAIRTEMEHGHKWEVEHDDNLTFFITESIYVDEEGNIIR